MKRYLGDLIEATGDWLCVLTGHWHGCWLLNQSPLRRLYWWAISARWDDPHTPHHGACPLCHFARHDYVPRGEHARAVEESYLDGQMDGRKDALDTLPIAHAVSVASANTVTATWSRPRLSH